MSKYGFFSDPYFSVFGLTTGKYRSKKTPYLEVIRSEGVVIYILLLALLYKVYLKELNPLSVNLLIQCLLLNQSVRIFQALKKKTALTKFAIEINFSLMIDTAWKVYVFKVRIRISGTYFPVFGLNMERYGVSLRIHSKCWKIRTRKTPNKFTFHAVRCLAGYSMRLFSFNNIELQIYISFLSISLLE